MKLVDNTLLFSVHEIRLLLENLVLGNAPGPDGLSTYILKHCASEISPDTLYAVT